MRCGWIGQSIGQWHFFVILPQGICAACKICCGTILALLYITERSQATGRSQVTISKTYCKGIGQGKMHSQHTWIVQWCIDIFRHVLCSCWTCNVISTVPSARICPTLPINNCSMWALCRCSLPESLPGPDWERNWNRRNAYPIALPWPLRDLIVMVLAA